MRFYPEQVQHFVVCIAQGEYLAALEIGKIYPVLEDSDAAVLQMVRIIDESGEDYLYPNNYFMAIDLPQPIQVALRKAA